MLAGKLIRSEREIASKEFRQEGFLGLGPPRSNPVWDLGFNGVKGLGFRVM